MNPLIPSGKTMVGCYIGGYSLFCQFEVEDCQVLFDYINWW